MTARTHRLPDGTIPVLVSADTAELLRDEAAALLSYATNRPEVAPQAIADMLFRTRIARRHRALAMVADRAELLGTLRAVVDCREHPALVRVEYGGSVGQGPPYRLCLSRPRGPAPRDGPALLRFGPRVPGGSGSLR